MFLLKYIFPASSAKASSPAVIKYATCLSHTHLEDN